MPGEATWENLQAEQAGTEGSRQSRLGFLVAMTCLWLTGVQASHRGVQDRGESKLVLEQHGPVPPECHHCELSGELLCPDFLNTEEPWKPHESALLTLSMGIALWLTLGAFTWLASHCLQNFSFQTETWYLLNNRSPNSPLSCPDNPILLCAYGFDYSISDK